MTRREAVVVGPVRPRALGAALEGDDDDLFQNLGAHQVETEM